MITQGQAKILAEVLQLLQPNSVHFEICLPFINYFYMEYIPTTQRIPLSQISLYIILIQYTEYLQMQRGDPGSWLTSPSVLTLTSPRSPVSRCAGVPMLVVVTQGWAQGCDGGRVQAGVGVLLQVL